MKYMPMFSPEIDRKIARPGSIIFMILAWLGMLALLIYWFVLFSAAIFLYVWFDVLFALFLVPLILIPVQVVRYFRQKRP
jgi:hypothetical protein